MAHPCSGSRIALRPVTPGRERSRPTRSGEAAGPIRPGERQPRSRRCQAEPRGHRNHRSRRHGPCVRERGAAFHCHSRRQGSRHPARGRNRRGSAEFWASWRPRCQSVTICNPQDTESPWSFLHQRIIFPRYAPGDSLGEEEVHRHVPVRTGGFRRREWRPGAVRSRYGLSGPGAWCRLFPSGRFPARAISGRKRRDRVPPHITGPCREKEGAESDRGSWREAARGAGPFSPIDPHYRMSI